MSRRRYSYPSTWEFLLTLLAVGAGVPAIVFVIFTMVTGVHP